MNFVIVEEIHWLKYEEWMDNSWSNALIIIELHSYDEMEDVKMTTSKRENEM